jgi:hypothetical protein
MIYWSLALGNRLVVGQRTLNPYGKVRILLPQPFFRMAHSSSGLGHRPLKAEITGSNPVCATNAFFTAGFEAKLLKPAVIFFCFANGLLTG